MFVNENLLIAIFLLIFSNIAVFLLIIFAGASIYEKQKLLMEAFEDIVSQYFKVERSFSSFQKTLDELVDFVNDNECSVIDDV